VCGLFREAVLRHRNIPTDNIRLSQNNIVDPENRYKQIFKIQVELPADISAKDRQGILRSIERCTVKKVVQTGPEFVIEEVDNLDADAQALLTLNPASEAPISGQGSAAGADHRQYVGGAGGPGHQDRNRLVAQSGAQCVVAAYPRCAFADVLYQWQGRHQGKRLASALGEYIERLNCNHFYNDQFWGEDIANAPFVHYPDERWFKPGRKDALPAGILDEYCLEIYNPDGELRGSHLYDTNSGNIERGICRCPMCASRTARWCISRPT
jgi:ribosomal protein S12 methylthiotransferase accessory factor